MVELETIGFQTYLSSDIILSQQGLRMYMKVHVFVAIKQWSVKWQKLLLAAQWLTLRYCITSRS